MAGDLPCAANIADSCGRVLAAAVAFSRLILGVHYLTDVIGGWVSGVALLAATMAAATWSERSTAA